MEYYENLGMRNELMRDVDSQERDLTEQFEKDKKEKLDAYNEEKESAETEWLETKSEIFRKSNGQVASFFRKNKRQLERDLSALNLYDARKNVDKAIPWIPKKKVESFIEYNDRLYADWEKCIWQNITNFTFSKTLNGFWEEYSAFVHYDSIDVDPYGTLAGHTVTDNFTRFNGGDSIAFSRTYNNDSEGASEDSIYTMLDQTFKLQLGDRHQCGNISEVKVLVTVDGYGEGLGGTENFGTKFAVLDAEYVGVQQEDYLNELDEENDLNRDNLKDIWAEYDEAKLELDFDLEKDLNDAENGYNDDLRRLETELNQRKRVINFNWYRSIASIVIEANTKKAQGEDNTDLISRIYDSKTSMYNEIAQAEQEYREDEEERRLRYREEQRALRSDYQDRLSEVQDERDSLIQEENQRHSDIIDGIRQAYNEELEDWEDAAYDVYKEALDASKAELDEFFDKYEKDKKNKNQQFVNEWNSKIRDDYPELVLDDDYNIIDEGFPADQLPSDLRQWAFDSLQQPIWNYNISWSQPTEDAINTRWSADAEAELDYQQNKNDFERLDENKRELWMIDASELASFVDMFTDEQQTEFKSAWGERGVFRFSIVKVWAKLDYGAETGVEYPDYYEIDNPDEKNGEEDKEEQH